ncbi:MULTISPECIES: hypothetical protein [Brachymonas]|uniref:hypothetical protein n=1 Tax=Brachymonas TaxID=28219 RepID=UPI002E76BD97|nr:hypothetical protein [Brachymonas sp. J145]MEE1653770.1 hypothetical protein [Brachymonas sp. J145]
MTHEQACRKAAAFYQSLAADRHEKYRRFVDEGENALAALHSEMAAENAAIARALMKIEGGEA